MESSWNSFWYSVRKYIGLLHLDMFSLCLMHIVSTSNVLSQWEAPFMIVTHNETQNIRASTFGTPIGYALSSKLVYLFTPVYLIRRQAVAERFEMFRVYARIEVLHMEVRNY